MFGGVTVRDMARVGARAVSDRNRAWGEGSVGARVRVWARLALVRWTEHHVRRMGLDGILRGGMTGRVQSLR